MDPMTANWRMLLVFGALTGGAIGSFLNVVAWRLPRGQAVTHPPSACPHCGHRIRPRHNVPVLGWLLLRGRCFDCGEPIAGRYPAVEALCLGLWVLLFLDLLPEASHLVEPAQLVPYFLYGLYFSALLAISLIDLDHFIVPDSISLPLVPLGIGAVALMDHTGLGRISFVESVFGVQLIQQRSQFAIVADFLRAVRGDPQNAGLIAAVDQALQHLQRAFVGPVHVLEHDRHRAAHSGGSEELEDSVE